MSLPRIAGPVIPVVSCVGLGTLLVDAYQSAPESAALTHAGRTLYTTPERAAWLDDVLSSVDQHAEPGDRVFFGTTDMSLPAVNLVELYHLLPEYRSDFYYFEIPEEWPTVPARPLSPTSRRQTSWC